MAHWYGGSKISKTSNSSNSNSNFGGSGLAGPPVTCETQVSLSGSLFPSHEACRYQDEEANRGCNSFIGGPYTPSTSRCFSELGFTCRNAYMMPCVQDYDYDGELVEGNGCPEMFK